MQVSITKAAKMVGVSRATFYKHIDSRGISTVKDIGGQPKVDVSELIRIYGDRVKVTEKKEEQGASNSNEERNQSRSAKDNQLLTELEVLKERLSNLEEGRRLERELLNEQIDLLKKHLEETQKNLTESLDQKRILMITDGRGQGVEKNTEQEEKLKKLEETIALLLEQNVQSQKRDEERERRIQQRRLKKEEAEKENEIPLPQNKSILKRLFG